MLLDPVSAVVVQLTVVQVVDVVVVADRGVAAARSVLVIVVGASWALLQATIRSSWLVLFRRRPPSSVATTMSSIRTPKRPGR